MKIGESVMVYVDVKTHTKTEGIAQIVKVVGSLDDGRAMVHVRFRGEKEVYPRVVHDDDILTIE